MNLAPKEGEVEAALDSLLEEIAGAESFGQWRPQDLKFLASYAETHGVAATTQIAMEIGIRIGEMRKG